MKAEAIVWTNDDEVNFIVGHLRQFRGDVDALRKQAQTYVSRLVRRVPFDGMDVNNIVQRVREAAERMAK